MAMKCGLIVLLVLGYFWEVDGLTFYLTEGKERCFHDEYAPNTVIIGSHQLIDKLPPKFAKDGVTLRVLDPDNNQMITKLTNNEEGKFTFTTKKGIHMNDCFLAGKYQVCLKAPSTKWFGEKQKPKYMLRLKQGDELELNNAAKESNVNHFNIILGKWSQIANHTTSKCSKGFYQITGHEQGK